MNQGEEERSDIRFKETHHWMESDKQRRKMVARVTSERFNGTDEEGRRSKKKS